MRYNSFLLPPGRRHGVRGYAGVAPMVAPAGCEIGARTANIIAALWPGRCKASQAFAGAVLEVDGYS